MSFFSRAAGALFKLVAENVKRFTLGFLSGAACYALLLGAMAYSLLRNESPWQTYVAGVLVAVGAILAGVVTGARVAATQTLRDWVDSTGAGPMLSKVIFKQALGSHQGFDRELRAKCVKIKATKAGGCRFQELEAQLMANPAIAFQTLRYVGIGLRKAFTLNCTRWFHAATRFASLVFSIQKSSSPTSEAALLAALLGR